MTNETVEKAKADVKKGIAEVGKAATSLKDDVKADVEMLKANFGHNADVMKKSDATRVLVTDADAGAMPDSGKKGLMQRPIQRRRGRRSNPSLVLMQV